MRQECEDQQGRPIPRQEEERSSSTVCLGPRNIFLYFHFLCQNLYVIKRYSEELSTMSKDEPLTPNIDKVMGI